jgi:tetratricopeptide (TPR) repeat protein
MNLKHLGMLLGSFLAISLGAAISTASAQVLLDATKREEGSVESVRAAYTAGRNKEAVLLADQAISQLGNAEPPASLLAELHFWRGASLRRLERFDEAVIALNTSQRLGLRVPELHLERALSRRALKQEQEAEQDYYEAERLLPPDDERRFRFAERWNSVAKSEPTFQVTVTPQLGFDSNIFGLQQDAPLVDDDVEEESFYYGLVFGAKYFLHRSESQILAIDFRNQLRAYAEDRELNYAENVVSALGRQPFLEWADIEVRASLGDAVSGGEGHLRTTRTVAPAFLFHFSPVIQARLWGDWTDADYYLSDLPAEQDRDGLITRAGVVFGLDLGGGWNVAPHVSFSEYDADGDDYDHRALLVGLALTMGEYLGCVFSPAVSYTRADYEHENSVVGFSEKREDRILRFALSITLRELEKVIGYAPSLTLAFVDHSSNLDAFDYERFEPRVEMTVVAMSF